MAWQNLKSMGLHNMPGVPEASTYDVADTLAKLNTREGELRPALDGLSLNYTIGGHVARAYDFLLGNPQLRNLALDTPDQFAISWTTYKDVYKDGMRDAQAPFVESLTDARAATGAFWNAIAFYGTAYNLLILRRLAGTRFNEVKNLLRSAWGRRWTESDFDQIQREGRLYEIDFSMFESLKPYYWHDKQARYNPATLTLLVRDKQRPGILEPVCIRVWTSQLEEVHRYTYFQIDPAWLYALQAAKTSATLYGIWLGHVYHLHIVTAAMQRTMYDTIPSDHAVYKLLQPQSNFLIGFDYALFNKFLLNAIDLFSQIAPPSCLGDGDSVLKVMDRFAAGRQFFDDDPKSEIAKNGLEEAHFSLHKPWDMYPVARHALLVWDICERFVKEFVATTYRDDRGVASDTALQNWMRASADPNQGNIRGLPALNSREALTRVLTSLVYRVTMHGVSRLSHTANPELTWVGNFPPCLQRGDTPWPLNALSTKELLTYLPNTGTIGEMMKFYYAFAFSKPYVPMLPGLGSGPDLYFSGTVLTEPRNAALVKFRTELANFVNHEYKWWRKPVIADTTQWPRNIET